MIPSFKPPLSALISSCPWSNKCLQPSQSCISRSTGEVLHPCAHHSSFFTTGIDASKHKEEAAGEGTTPSLQYSPTSPISTPSRAFISSRMHAYSHAYPHYPSSTLLPPPLLPSPFSLLRRAAAHRHGSAHAHINYLPLRQVRRSARPNRNLPPPPWGNRKVKFPRWAARKRAAVPARRSSPATTFPVTISPHYTGSDCTGPENARRCGLLTEPINLYAIFYGTWTEAQKELVRKFVGSFNPTSDASVTGQREGF